MIHKTLTLALIGGTFSLPLPAQTSQKADTVVVNLATTSRIMFTMQDRKDITILKHFDFQSFFNDMLTKIENSDTLQAAPVDTTIYSPGHEERWSLEKREEDHDDDNNNDDDNDDSNDWKHSHKRKWRKHWQSFNIDLGTNNYLSNGKFPDANNALYSVRPWGSWYVAANSIQRSRLARKFFVEWGLGVSWYNFKFQKDNILLEKNDHEVVFYADSLHSNFVKSKLTASYINASFIPVIDFSGHGSKRSRDKSLRVGLGPYVGYRIGSYSKLVYEVNGDDQKDKNKDNFYLENFRYGLRLQVGFHSTDLFFNYDMNNLFTTGKGPSLNAFSFGVIL